MKLTKPQLELLNQCRDGKPYKCSFTYKPAQKLIEFGLVVGNTGKFGGFRITITEAGLAALEQSK